MSKSESSTTRTTRPALDVLDRDQEQLLFTGDEDREPPIKPLIHGFSSPRELLYNYQAACIRTLGRIDNVLPPEALKQGPVRAALLNELSPAASEEFRSILVSRIVDACRAAYREFRVRAAEHVRTGDTESSAKDFRQVDTENQANPLMRPAFAKLDQQQAGALTQLLGGAGETPGFRGEAEVYRFVQSLNAATHGEIGEDFAHRIKTSPPVMERLIQEGETAQRFRLRLAIHELLPAFSSAASSLTGSERLETPSNAWREG